MFVCLLLLLVCCLDWFLFSVFEVFVFVVIVVVGVVGFCCCCDQKFGQDNVQQQTFQERSSLRKRCGRIILPTFTYHELHLRSSFSARASRSRGSKVIVLVVVVVVLLLLVTHSKN